MTDTKLECDKKKMNEILLSPYNYIRQVKSNELLASTLGRALNYWLHIPDEKMEATEEILRIITQAFILFDDIQDNSDFRRKLPTAQCVFGVPLTINASFQAFLLGLKKVLELGHPQAAEVFCDGFLVIMHGQGTEIHWRESLTCPSEEEYKQMATDKSSYLLMFLRLMQLFSKNKTDYSKFISYLGVYYTIRDEYCNLSKVEALEGECRAAELKDLSQYYFCEDITEGRFSWPVIHALQTSNAPTIYYILKQRTRDEQLKRYCVSLLDKAGSLKYTRNTLRQLEKELRMELHRLSGNPLMEELLDDLSYWDYSEQGKAESQAGKLESQAGIKE